MAPSCEIKPKDDEVEHGMTDDAETFLARELAKLSLVERERILFDLHGVSQADVEDPKMIASKLDELEDELAKIKSKDAYLRAKALDDAGYLSNKAFRLMFLRCRDFDARSAAEILVSHFEMKRMVFGDGEILVRDVKQSDLSREQLDFLYSGVMQALPVKDSAGRLVLLMNGSFHEEHMEQMIKAIFYYSMVLLRDVEAQRKGCVWVNYNYINPRIELENLLRLRRDFCQMAVPKKLVSGHFCGSRDLVDLRRSVAEFELQTCLMDRFRIRIHQGTHKEISRSLLSYGINMRGGPIQDDGRWSNTTHAARLEELKAHEEDDSPGIIPEPFDVLLGRTSRSRDFTGNKRLAHLCLMFFRKFTESNRVQKTELTARLVSIIHQSGGKFLQWEEECGWEEADDEVAHGKVAHTFRYTKAKLAKQESKKKLYMPSPIAPERHVL